MRYISVLGFLVFISSIYAAEATPSVPTLTIRNRANKEVRVDIALEPLVPSGAGRSATSKSGVVRDVEVKAHDTNTVALSGADSCVIKQPGDCSFEMYGYAVSGTSYLGGAQYTIGKLRSMEMIILENGAYFLPVPSSNV